MAPTLATNSPRLHFGEAVGDFGADSHLFWLVLRVRGRRLGAWHGLSALNAVNQLPTPPPHV